MRMAVPPMATARVQALLYHTLDLDEATAAYAQVLFTGLAQTARLGSAS
jgi:hypothetical protein